MTRKPRADSKEYQAELIHEVALGVVIPPYVTVTEEERPFFDAIIRAKTGWTEMDIIVAANLAACSCAIESEREGLRNEGSVIENGRGTPVMNPRHTVLEQLSRRQSALMTKLQVHSTATGGDADNNRKKNAAKKDAVSVMESIEDDDLIARPH